MELRELLYERIRSEIDKWDTDGVYAIYFGISTNAVDGNIPHFVIGRGVECEQLFPDDKWHLAVSAFDETEITADSEAAQAVTDWLHAQGVTEIGYEDPNEMYDDMMMYIGKGPSGSYELLQLGVKIAEQLFDEGYIRGKFGRDIPVIFDDLETTWYNLEATENANPKGLANEFLREFSSHRKNSPQALLLVLLANAAMGFSGMFRIGAFVPLTLFSVIFTLLFGGIRFPLTVGGKVKTAVVAVVSVMLLLSLRRIRAYMDGIKPVLRLMAIRAADIILAAVCLFSCNFAADRAAAGIMLLGFAIFCAIDYSSMKKGLRSLAGEQGSEISKQLSELRDNNGKHN